MSGSGSDDADACSRYRDFNPNLNIHRYRDIHSDRHRDIHSLCDSDSASTCTPRVDPVH